MNNKVENNEPNSKAKAVNKAGGAVEKAGTATKAVGTATSAVGKTAKVAGTAGKYGGKAINYAGKGATTAGKNVMQAGKSLSSSGYGAIVGVPLMAAGAALAGTGKTAEVAGKATEKAGEAVNKAGKSIDETGKKIKKTGIGLKEKGNKIKSSNNSLSKRNSNGLKINPRVKRIMIIMGIIGFIFSLLMFFMIMFAPLITLGIVTVGVTDGLSGTSSSSSSPYTGYTNISNNVEYWVAIGGSQATQSNGRTYASGEPIDLVVTSSFGYRIDPFTGATSYHSGIDLAPSGGSYGYGEVNVIAAKSGTVTSAIDIPNCESNGNNESCGGSGYGNYIMIQHDDGISTLYGHLHKGTITVKEGDKVDQGQVIGKMGSSGRSTGMHLHFEVRENGTAVEPLNYISFENARPTSGSTSNKDTNEGVQNE